MKAITLLILMSLSIQLHAEESDLDPHLLGDILYSTSKDFQDEDRFPLENKALLPDQNSFNGGYNHLLKHVLPSIYQANAGSCLFMSHTSALEVLYSYSFGKSIDFSERYMMNLAMAGVGDSRMNNWRTDTIYRINESGKMQEQYQYPFTMGWYKIVNGKKVAAKENEQGAWYSVKFNWVVDEVQLSKPGIIMPRLERDILFEDQEQNQWNVGQAPEDIVKRMKDAFQKRKAPIVVIYNHTGFWHAVNVVGYNDNADSAGCPFMSSYKHKMDNRAEEIREEARQTNDPKEKRRLERKADTFNSRGKQVNDKYIRDGGCRGKGVFYVRDSIYPVETQPLYDYDPTRQGEEVHLNAPIILREYEWVEQVANHAYQIYFE